MRVGFTTIFSYRPHVEHMFYLSEQFRKNQHDVFFLNCNGSLPNCYNLEFKNGHRYIECAKCRVGSLASYTKKNTSFISNKVTENLSSEICNEISSSSCNTLTRIENPKDLNSDEIKSLQVKLEPAVKITYANAKKWIIENKLDFVFLFNGRMEVTRAIMQACLDTKTPFCCVERTLFANGLQLNFGKNALSLEAIHKLEQKFYDKPLFQTQALKAAELLTSRFRSAENLEWRNYNKDEQKLDWPREGSGLKILILPSSKNEVFGQNDWRNEWEEYPAIFEKIIQKLGGDFSNTILRGHPNWHQKIGVADGSKIYKYYSDWSKAQNIEFIGSDSKISTSHLMAQADVVLLNGSSAVYEASILGTPSICVSRCRYQNANLAKVILSEEDLNKFDVTKFFERSHKDLLRATLRFFYTYAARYAIFNNNIVAQTIHHFTYTCELDFNRLLKMMERYELIPDDTNYASNEEEENIIIDIILEKNWQQLVSTDTMNKEEYIKVDRRGLYFLVDHIRNLLKRGDI